jgi:hypothetical protein
MRRKKRWRSKRYLKSRKSVRIGRDKKFNRKVNRWIKIIKQLPKTISGIIDAVRRQAEAVKRMCQNEKKN